MIVIIKGCGSNISSIQYALNRLGVKPILTDDPTTIRSASRVILPGVGHAQRAMQTLTERGLDQLICELTMPVLGICLGMQLLYEFTEEGNTQSLGVIPGQVRKFVTDRALPIPHMGWNRLSDSNHYVYFVHSFYAPVNEYTVASTHYLNDFCAMVKYNNFCGMQFHPERSGQVGEKLLKEFLEVS